MPTCITDSQVQTKLVRTVWAMPLMFSSEVAKTGDSKQFIKNIKFYFSVLSRLFPVSVTQLDTEYLHTQIVLENYTSSCQSRCLPFL